MSNLEKTIITKTELQDVQETLITLINSFPELPEQVKKDGVSLENLKPKNVSMCLSTVLNPYKVRVDIDGSYLAKYQFKIIFQTMDTNNNQRIDSQALLSKIGEWLEGRTLALNSGLTYEMGDYPSLSDGRRIIKLCKDTIPKLVYRLPSNIEVSEAKFTLEYYVKNDF